MLRQGPAAEHGNNGSLRSAFRARTRAKYAIAQLAIQREQRCRDVDKTLVYLICGLLNLKRVPNVQSVAPSTADDLNGISRLFGIEVHDHLPTLVRKGLFVDTPRGYIVASPALWAGIVDVLADGHQRPTAQ